MAFSDPSAQRAVEAVVAGDPGFRVAGPGDEEAIHALLESTGMALSGGLELFSSRRPDLARSFRESYGGTTVFVDGPPLRFVAALSEVTVLREGRPVRGYYASDLRLGRGASRQVRRRFGERYLALVRQLPPASPCFTAVLDDNVPALNRLVRGGFPAHYNRAVSYVTRTLVIAPTAGLPRPFARDDLEICEVQPADEAAVAGFVAANVARLAFSDDVAAGRARRRGAQREFIACRRGEPIAYFSVHRPAHRGLAVRSDAAWVRLLSRGVRAFTGADPTRKLPCVYLSALVLSEAGRDSPTLLPALVRWLARHRVVRPGEMLLALHPDAGAPCFQTGRTAPLLAGCPQFVRTAGIYFVEPEARDRRLGDAIHLDPTAL